MDAFRLRADSGVVSAAGAALCGEEEGDAVSAGAWVGCAAGAEQALNSSRAVKVNRRIFFISSPPEW